MSSGERRLDRLCSGLTAAERVLLLHRALLEDREPDPAIRDSTPTEQRREFNHFVAVGNGVLHTLCALTALVEAQVEGLRNLQLALHLVSGWGADLSAMAFTLQLAAQEPISERDYQSRVEDARAVYLSFAEARAYSEDARKEAHEAELRQAVESGAVRSRRRGRRVELELGSLCDWLGEPIAVRPDWLFEYRVVPNDEWEAWSAQGRLIAVARDRVAGGPSEPARVFPVPHVAVGELLADPERPETDRAARGLTARLCSGICSTWSDLVAIEMVLAEVREEFGGKEVAPPVLTASLARSRESLEQIHRENKFSEPFDLPEVNEQWLRKVRAAVGRDEQLYM